MMDSGKEINQRSSENMNQDESSGKNKNADCQEKRKRRSKNDPEGRMFKCTECGKSYLSQPALTNHSKTKHSDQFTDLKRGRGRPRKNFNNSNQANENAEQKFKCFFEKEQRVSSESDKIEVSDFVKKEFNSIFRNYRDRIFKNFTDIEDCNFYQIFLRTDLPTPRETRKLGKNGHKEENLTDDDKPIIDDPKNMKDEKFTCDEIFSFYIREVAQSTNSKYFAFVFKFVLLFRECINSYRGKTGEQNGDVEFTQVNNAETVPDLCNEFVTDFMENNEYFGLDNNELIEIIQHFCHWLYEKGYTASRLTLLNG